MSVLVNPDERRVFLEAEVNRASRNLHYMSHNRIREFHSTNVLTFALNWFASLVSGNWHRLRCGTSSGSQAEAMTTLKNIQERLGSIQTQDLAGVDDVVIRRMNELQTVVFQVASERPQAAASLMRDFGRLLSPLPPLLGAAPRESVRLLRKVDRDAYSRGAFPGESFLQSQEDAKGSFVSRAQMPLRARKDEALRELKTRCSEVDSQPYKEGEQAILRNYEREQEEAQDQALEGLREVQTRSQVALKATPSGQHPDFLYDASAMTDDLYLELAIDPASEGVAIATDEELLANLNKEVSGFEENGLITAEEKEVILKEANTFVSLYKTAFPLASLQQVYTITRDNVRFLAYQEKRDKYVFAGSDHGTRHIVRANITFADQILDGLAKSGQEVTALDRVLLHQAIMIHDMGYAFGVAQTHFGASKDHPLGSTLWLEANADYFKAYFGEAGYEQIRRAVLYHSYPKPVQVGEAASDVKSRRFHPDLIRSVLSTVDALGTTYVHKVPAFFANPRAVTVLQQLQMYALANVPEVCPGATPEERKKESEQRIRAAVDGPIAGRTKGFRQALEEIAREEPNPERREAFLNAVRMNFNARTPEFNLGLFGGILEEVGIAVGDEGQTKIQLTMSLSQSQALLQSAWGDDLAVQSFLKVMQDMGLRDSEAIKLRVADTLRRVKEADPSARPAILSDLRVETDRAVFQFNPALSEHQEFVQCIGEVEQFSLRMPLKMLVKSLKDPSCKRLDDVERRLLAFQTFIDTKTNLAELHEFTQRRKEIQRIAQDLLLLQADIKPPQYSAPENLPKRLQELQEDLNRQPPPTDWVQRQAAFSGLKAEYLRFQYDAQVNVLVGITSLEEQRFINRTV